MVTPIICGVTASLGLASCASIVIKKTHPVNFHSADPHDKIALNHEIYNLPAHIILPRSKTPLKIKLLSDSSSKNYTILPRLERWFVYGNLMWMELSPLAYAIDLTTPRRFSYGSNIMLSARDTITVINLPKKFPTRKGNIFLRTSFLAINSFYLVPAQQGSKSSTGFFGTSLGIDYYLKDTHYVTISATAAIDYPLPIPVGIDYNGPVESLTTLYTSITYNYKFYRWHTGYGLNFSRNFWTLDNGTVAVTNGLENSVSRTSNAFGITANIYRQFTRHLFAGVIYRPTFLRITPTEEFKYEHFITLDVCWKFKLR